MEEEKNQLHLHLWIPTTLSKLETRQSKSTKFFSIEISLERWSGNAVTEANYGMLVKDDKTLLSLRYALNV